MAITILSNGKEAAITEALHAVDSSLDIRAYPIDEPREDITFALTWNHSPGALQGYPNLKAVSSLGAGIDHLLRDPQLPRHLPMVRLVDPQLQQSMFDYVLTAVMFYYREFDRFYFSQTQHLWERHSVVPMAETTVGILGLGQLGGTVATRLVSLGFSVVGWARSPKSIEGVTNFHGPDQLSAFLSQTQLLVCLLPLTAETRGLLNYDTLSQLPSGAYVINVARGPIVVDEDLIRALDEGHLAGACLDVFHEEPLPQTHSFWSHPKVLVTPHSSSITHPQSVAPQIVENYRRLSTGEPLLNLVDLERGY